MRKEIFTALSAALCSKRSIFLHHAFLRHRSYKQNDPWEPSLDFYQINRWQLLRACHVPDSVLSPSHINSFSLHNNPVGFGAIISSRYRWRNETLKSEVTCPKSLLSKWQSQNPNPESDSWAFPVTWCVKQSQDVSLNVSNSPHWIV